MRPLKFILPHKPDKLQNAEKKVVVVSIIGKSQYRAKGCKTEMLSSILLSGLLDDPTVDENTLSEIEGYHSVPDRTVYLHLRSLLDTHTLVNQYESFVENRERKDFLSIWAHMRDKCARALLVLFHISHIIIVTNPGHTFDYSYIHLFRALEIVRNNATLPLSFALSGTPCLTKAWETNSRPCSPRVLFYFETCPAVFRDPDSGASIKKLEHSLEDQIYHVLRKHRIVTNISSNSLFAIPANQEFVYVHTGSTESRDLLGYMTRSLIKSCSTTTTIGSTNRSCTSLPPLNIDMDTEMRSFRLFLQQHINLAFSKGFDDNVGRHTVTPHFDIPSLKLFFEVANKLYNFFLLTPDNKPLAALHGLLDTDVKFSKSRCGKVMPMAVHTYQDNLPAHYGRAYHETKLAHAMAVFELHARGPLYAEFSAKLQLECDKHWRSGRQMCEVLSLTGNPCTNPIHNGGNEGAGGGEHVDPRPDDSELPVMPHCSGVRYVCACNCGRYQGPREDPFNLRHANYDYFQILGKQCGCSLFESIQFPVFQPSTHNFRAAQLFSGGIRKDSLSRTEFSTPQGQTQACSLGDNTLHGTRTPLISVEQSAYDPWIEEPCDLQDSFKEGVSLHFPAKTYASGGRSQLSNDPAVEEARRLANKTSLTPGDAQKIVIRVTDAEPENPKDNRNKDGAVLEKSLVRQPSTTEYLPGMLHTESPAGLLPQFSSWSLVCLGPSSLYSHNLGLQHQAGVLPTSAFLLPWDVTVRLEHQKDRGSYWPTVGDHDTRNYFQRSKNFQSAMKCRKLKGGKEFVVKIFVGVEYECPRGHRFMAAAPDKVLKATGSGIVKDSGNKVTSSTTDMPLYFPCPCRQPKPLIAQLMRIHVVTPKAPVHVTLNPRVQPGPAPCPIFVTGWEEPIKLSQSAYWILRLPYVYMGEKGPYMTPKEPVPISHGRLLAGMYGISEVVPEKK